MAAVPVGKAVPVAQPAVPTAMPVSPARQATPQQKTPDKNVPAAIPLDADDDPYGLDTSDLSNNEVDDYESKLSSAAGATPMINPLAARRTAKGDQAFQQAIVYTLVGLAVVIVLMIGFQIVRRAIGPLEELFQSAPVTEPAAEVSPAAPTPQAPAPAPPGSQDKAASRAVDEASR